MSDYLFPNRTSRREFIASTAASVAAVALGATAAHADDAQPIRIGSGAHTYEADLKWGHPQPGMAYGHGCGIVVDGKDRIFVTTRSANPFVSIFDADGKLLEMWNKDFAEKVDSTLDNCKDTAHGLYLSKENGTEYLYWTENAGGGKDEKFGARVYKTDLQGKIIYQIGNVAKEGSASQKFAWDNPTDVAVAPNGDIYVVDGYGSQRVTRFDKDFKPLRTIGAHGKGDSEFQTCHGICINTLKSSGPEVYIADRENGRLQVFDLELNHKRNISGPVRRPCCFFQHDGFLFIPDLASRVTVLDADDKLVAQLGDGKETDGRTDRPDQQTNPALFAAPHALNLDSKGNLYVVEWIPSGRPRKFSRVTA